MKKLEYVYREILCQTIENKTHTLTQSYLASKLKISLSTVNNAVQPLIKMNAIKVNLKNFNIIDAKKILLYWASIRNLKKDILYQARAERPVKDIEANMPADIIYAAYSAYKFKYKDVPADYSEVYVYADEKELKEIINRFSADTKNHTNNSTNIFNLYVLKKDMFMDKLTTAQLFVDLWNMQEWYAKDFLNALEVKLGGILE